VANLLLAIVLMSAAVDASLEASVTDCRTLPDDAARLQCYDAAVDGSADVAAATQPAGAEAPTAATAVRADESPPADVASAAAAEAEFGFEDHVKGAPNRLTGSVTETARNAKGGLIITLDNGQVWQQTGGERLFLDPGDTVYLFRGAMSAFYLSLSTSGRRYRVSRIR